MGEYLFAVFVEQAHASWITALQSDLDLVIGSGLATSGSQGVVV